MSKRKTKMLSVRISEDEYETLKSTYTSSGTRSVSAFAREALRRVIRSWTAGEDGVQTAVSSLDPAPGILQDEASPARTRPQSKE